MKKLIALSFTAMCLVTCLTACGNKAIKGTETVTQFDGHTMAVVTQEDGAPSRNENGDIIVVVTNEDGKPFKDKDGKNETQIADLDTAFVYGNRIEFNDFYIEIPNGWENNSSYAMLDLAKKGSTEKIMISKLEKTRLVEKVGNTTSMFNAAKDKFPDAVITNSSVEVAGEDCPLLGLWVPKGDNGKSAYIGYVFLQSDSDLYQFMFTSEKNIGDDLDEIVGIFNSVQYK